MLHWDEINNQLHDIVVALIWEVVLWFERHKLGHSLQHESIEILHLWWWIFGLHIVSPSNISYHVTHPIDIIISIRLISYRRLDLPVLVPQKVVRHKSLLTKVTRYLILQQYPSVLTPTARATRFTTATSKS
jgi:hypothetical protein